MDNLEKYNNAFMETFEITEEELTGLKYQDIEAWDSVGHMSLVSALEDAFDIMMDTDDIIDLNSYEKGREILAKGDYGVEFLWVEFVNWRNTRARQPWQTNLALS